MTLYYSTGFLVASLIQAAFIFFTENSGISRLVVNMSLNQLIIHVIVGQLGGYLLLYLMRKVHSIEKQNTYLIGIVYGLIFGIFVAAFNVLAGNLFNPAGWSILSLLSFAASFILYGLLAVSTVRNVMIMTV